MDVQLANPRGFCAGVDRAVAVVGDLLTLFDEPIFVRHEIVHNRAVVEELRARGAVFVQDVDEIPPGAIAVISAHGAAPSVYSAARARGLRVFDATCPLVTRVQLKVARHARHGESVIVIGHRNHAEVQGLVGCYRDGPGVFVVETEAEAETVAVPTPEQLGYVTQTTLALDQTKRIIETLRRRFPKLMSPQAQDICYATQNRQNAVKTLAKTSRLVFVVGAPHSSNSIRLCETVIGEGAEARLIESAKDIEPAWLIGRDSVGVTASASAPEWVVQEVLARLRALSPSLRVTEIGEAENVVFRLPQALLNLQNAASRAPAKAGRVGAGHNSLMNMEKEEVGMNNATNLLNRSEAGLSSVLRSAAELALKARDLVEQAGGFAERELAMVLNVAEETRDKMINPTALERARKIPLLHDLRADAQRAVTLGFDAVAVTYLGAAELLEGLASSRHAGSHGGHAVAAPS